MSSVSEGSDPHGDLGSRTIQVFTPEFPGQTLAQLREEEGVGAHLEAKSMKEALLGGRWKAETCEGRVKL
ncbi:hypothetical protein E2C01_042237 [Portunus trituberculatus]|uniref:Uncharacterized protein n=1 Tax=Portunus trituberculatus TaxID=210409 RepID=A0A5B7FVX7_PORTR|nr:hypothetical protein [Portunus trituberculatus]